MRLPVATFEEDSPLHTPEDSVVTNSVDQTSVPFDFHRESVAAAANEKLKRSINNAVMRQQTARQHQLAALPHPDQLRTLAGQIKQHAIENLDFYLEQLADNVRKNGGHVHFAANGIEARQIILDIARRQNATRVIKSKSMVNEEINLAHVLEQAGLDVVETDLG